MHDALTAAASGNDQKLVFLAISLCVFGAIAASRVLQLALASNGTRRLVWTGAAALVSGVAVWATFLIAAFAFNPGVPVSYNFLPALISLPVAVVVSALAFAILMRREAWAPVLAGAFLGYGLAAVDFLTLSSIKIAGRMAWDAGLLAMPLVYGLGFSVLAMLAVRALPNDRGLLSCSVALVAGAMRFISRVWTRCPRCRILPPVSFPVRSRTWSLPLPPRSLPAFRLRSFFCASCSIGIW